MISKSILHFFASCMVISLLVGCSGLPPKQSMKKPSMSTECRSVMDGLYDLKKDLGLPEHLMSENPVRQDTDFDPNQYFQVLTHLQMKPGYRLDFVYFNDWMGGMPLVYARETDSAPFQSYADYLRSFGEEPSDETSFKKLGHNSDYLGQVQADQTPESYFEFVSLAFLGDQFYLWWHSNYNDEKIMCDSSDVQYIEADLQGFQLKLPREVRNGIKKIDFTPTVKVDQTEVTVRFVTFTKWGGFYENIYVLDKDDPAKVHSQKAKPLIEYNCGIAF